MKVVQYNHRVEILEISPVALTLLKKILKFDYYRYVGKRRIFEKSENLLFKEDNTYYFPPGLLNYIDKKFEGINQDIELLDAREEPFYHLRSKNIHKPDNWKNQKEAFESLIEEGNEVGFVCGVTGSGKSRIIEDIVQHRGLNTLIVVPRSEIQYSLVKKLKTMYPAGTVSDKLPKDTTGFSRINNKKDNYEPKNKSEEYLVEKGFERRGGNWVKASKFSDNTKKKKTANIVVTCFQSLNSITQEALDSFEFIIIDEGHTARNKTIRNTLLNAKNAYYRLFLSATLWAEVLNDMYLLMSATSDNLIYEELPIDTINDKRIKKPIIHSINSPLPEHAVGYWKNTKKGSKIVYSKDFDETVKLGIVGNHSRNQLICKIAIDEFKGEGRVLICIHERLHGELLQDMLKEMGYESDFICGQISKSDRREIVEKSQNDTDPLILIGTNAIGMGVDTKNMNSVILGDVRKSSLNVFQFIGRVLRANNLTDVANVYNFLDFFHPKLKEHSFIRSRICDEYYGKFVSMTEKMWSRVCKI